MTKKHKPRAPRAYVYALLDPRDGLPFYIGKGSGDRVLQHYKDFRAGHCRNVLKTAWIAEIVEAGLEPGHRIIAKGLTDGAALRLEAKIIAENRDIITNSYRIPKWKRDLIEAKAKSQRRLAKLLTYEEWTAKANWADRTKIAYKCLYDNTKLLAEAHV